MFGLAHDAANRLSILWVQDACINAGRRIDYPIFVPGLRIAKSSIA
jgi:hypothetical protein